MLYLIKYVKNKIALLEYESDMKSFMPMKKNGEVWQEYEEEAFWQWFKKKIEYEGEALSFVIMSESEHFSISQTIQLSKRNFIQNRTDIYQLVLNEIASRTQLSFFPPIKQTMAKQRKSKKKSPPKKESLSEYYAQKTKRYQGV
jgi:hypothetical protein